MPVLQIDVTTIETVAMRRIEPVFGEGTRADRPPNRLIFPMMDNEQEFIYE